MVAPDTVIRNRYRILRPLKEGTTKWLYEAFDESRQQNVALKMWKVPKGVENDIRYAAAIRADLTHPTLPAVIDHFAEEDNLYVLVSEWVAGPTLAERLQAQGAPFTPAQIVKWGNQLVDALIRLHRQSPTITHGDIKAENLKEFTSGDIALLDVELYTIGGHNTPTDEQDVYAVGAVLYHLATGVKAPSLKHRAEQGFLPSPATLNPALPPSLSAILEQSIAAGSGERFTSAYAFQNALKRVQSQLDNAPTKAAPRSPLLAAIIQQQQRDLATAPIASHVTGSIPAPLEAETNTKMNTNDRPRNDDENTPSDNTAADNARIYPPSDPFLSAEQPVTTPPPVPEPLPPTAPDPFVLSLGGQPNTPPSNPAPEPIRMENTPPYVPPTPETPRMGATPPEPERIRMDNPPPMGNTPPPPTGGSNNRLWFGLGIGCLVLLLVVCCGGAAVLYSGGSQMIEELGLEELTSENQNSNNNDNEDTEAPNGIGSNNGSNEDNEAGEAGETISVFDMSIKDCFNDPVDGELINEITLINCETPHDNEVFAIGDFPADGGDEFPGEPELDEYSDEFCESEFEGFVGSDYNDSMYYVSYLQPTEGTWDDGDREIVCILYVPDEKIEGTAEGSGN